MMIDVSSPKVVAPAIGFALLQFVPLKTLPKVFMLPILQYIVFTFFIKRTYTIADLLVPGVLFALLSPGVLFTFPPGANFVEAVIVHSIAFAVIFATLRIKFSRFY